MVLFLLFLLSVAAIAVIAVTGSELGMSVMTSDRSKALLAAQSGAESAAQDLDVQIAVLQDEARVKASEAIKNEIQKYSGDVIPATSIFHNVVDTSSVSDFKVLDKERLDRIYNEEYKYWFNKKLDAWISIQTSDGNPWNINKLHYVKKMAPDPTDTETEMSSEGTFRFSDISKKTLSGGANLTTVSGSDTQVQISSINMTSTGQYKSSTGPTYSRKINFEFGILTEGNGGASDVPVSYSNLTRVRVNGAADKPEILSKKALIARDNIISINGTADITGDVLSFGYIPASADVDAENNEDKYKTNLSGYEFGGIVAGITSSVFSNTQTGFYGSKLKENLEANRGVLELDSNFFTKNHSGSFNIKGNAGTLGYTHILYSDYTRVSKIEIEGNTYARSLKIENMAHSGQGQFKNVYLTDDLRIDASNAKISIGKWSNPYNMPITGEEGILVGLNTGTEGQYSSSVAILGDSELNINGSVYIGGSTYFNQYVFNGKEMYPSGISILKSGSAPARAFEIDEVYLPQPDFESFPGNVFYLYNNTKSNDTDPEYTNVNDPTEANKLINEQFKKEIGVSETGESILSDIKMMQGSTGKPDPDNPSKINDNYFPFFIYQRAMHFKKIWEKHWKDDIGYNTYLNAGDIRITTVSSGKIKGWCNGAVAANNNIYGPYNGFTEMSPDNYAKLVSDSFNPQYANYMKLFLKNTSSNGAIIKSLCEAEPQKELTGNSNTSDNSIDISAVAQDELIKSNDIIMLNSSENVVIGTNFIKTSKLEQNFSDDELELDSERLYLRGVIYSDKDIYIKDGVNFKGTLIAKGNIVFLGDSYIKYDEAILDSLIDDQPKVGRFFKYSPKDIIINERSSLATIRKANVKNIKILSWKEI